MPRYTVDRTDRVFDWSANVDGARFDAMLVWLRAVSIDPVMASTGFVENVPRVRSFYFADVPVAETRVTYQVVDLPARCVRILRIDDEDYQRD